MSIEIHCYNKSFHFDLSGSFHFNHYYLFVTSNVFVHNVLMILVYSFDLATRGVVAAEFKRLKGDSGGESYRGVLGDALSRVCCLVE